MAGGGEEGPFGFLEQMDPEMVADLLSQERPGTAAGILGLLNPGYADMVLQIMPPEMQEDLINRLQTQPQLPAFQQKTVAQQLKRRLGVPA
jgi:flagellar motor switch protein FliG